jgi:hypothetical protein
MYFGYHQEHGLPAQISFELAQPLPLIHYSLAAVLPGERARKFGNETARANGPHQPMS